MDKDKTIIIGLFRGALLAFLTILIIVAAVLPGRYGVALHESQFGQPMTDFLVAGLARDIHGYGPFYGLFFLLFWVVALFVVSRRSNQGAPSTGRQRVALAGYSLMAALPLWLFSVPVSEFKVQRGVYPSQFDMATGADVGFITHSLPVFFFDRYLHPTLALLALFGLLIAPFFKAMGPAPIGFSWARLGGFVAGMAAPVIFSFQVYLYSPDLFPSIHSRDEVVLPISRFMLDFGYFRNEYLGVRAGLESTPFTPEEAIKGGKLYGFSPEETKAVLGWKENDGCSPHPLARSLDTFHHGNELLTALREVSIQLFAGDAEKKVAIWHAILEGFRADDLSAFRKGAPTSLAPYTNEQYQLATTGDGAVLAARNMSQAGVRTSQALAATFCGMGGLPLSFSFARDFGNVPFRCLPDLMADAGIESTVFYGSNLSFDNMRAFFWYHGVKSYEETDFPADSPRGFWGLADLAVAHEALREIKRRPVGDTYSIILSLSNHDPFTRPEDMPDEVIERVNKAKATSAHRLRPEHFDRLVTYSYTDYVVQSVAEEANDGQTNDKITIIIAHADHVTNDYFLWRSPGASVADREWSFSRIPFFIKLPEEPPGLADKQAYGNAVRKAQQLMIATPLSENDIPALLTALLSAAPGMRGIAKPWRWVTYGGHASSPYYSSGWESALLWGINTRSKVYYVDNQGVVVDSGAHVPSFTSFDDFTTKTPELAPVSAFLSTFLKGYGAHCWEGKHIRQVAGQEEAGG